MHAIQKWNGNTQFWEAVGSSCPVKLYAQECVLLLNAGRCASRIVEDMPVR